MLTTLGDVVQRLIDGYDPERVILFGSHATGRANEGSDFDLLIIKQDERRPIDRRVEVQRLLADRQMPIDVCIYTPREMWELYQAGSAFIEEVVETGKVLYMRKVTEAWIRESEDELETASLLLEHGRYRGASLHSQQAAEKALKALLVEQAQRPPRTHDILDILNLVRAGGWSIDVRTDEAVFLSSIYRSRHPSDEGLLPRGEPTAQDAGKAVDYARHVVESVRTALNATDVTAPPSPAHGPDPTGGDREQ